MPARLLNNGQRVLIVVLQRPGIDFLEMHLVIQAGFFGKLLKNAGDAAPYHGLAGGGFAARVGGGQAVVFIRYVGGVVGQHGLVLAMKKTIADEQNGLDGQPCTGRPGLGIDGRKMAGQQARQNNQHKLDERINHGTKPEKINRRLIPKS